MNHPHPRIDALLQSLANVRMPVIALGLERIHALLAALGNPQERLPPVLHVAGTNGKGSTLAYLKAMLEAGGYRVHRYTSPHLVRFNERIVLAGQEIADDYLLSLLQRLEVVCRHQPATGFEATTALAFMAFSEVPADILLLETGLGGRLDATNILSSPLLTCITPVSMDHMDYLGNDLATIAGEKAGILKKGVPCVVAPQAPVALARLEAVAQQVGAPLWRNGKEWGAVADAGALRYRENGKAEYTYPLPGLEGEHQVQNAGTALACAQQLRGFTLSHDAMASGIAGARWPARLQRLEAGSLAALLPPSCSLWLDGGHNESAAAELARWMVRQPRPVHVVCGMLHTKDSAAFLRLLAPVMASLTCVAIAGEPLSRSGEELVAIAEAAGIEAALAQDLKSAIQSIVNKNNNQHSILICGSLSLAGNTLWQNGTPLI